jgi:hypothetical protein
MLSVPEVTTRIVERSRYLTEAISKGLINLSSLARYIQPEVEEILIKKVSASSILMALKRYQRNLKMPRYPNVFRNPPDMLIRTNLRGIAVTSLSITDELLGDLSHMNNDNNTYFLMMSQGLAETSIIVSNNMYDTIKSHFQSKCIRVEYPALCAVTIRLPDKSIRSPGVYYFFLKSLTWETVNIIEMISTPHELTLFFEEKDLERAFTILQSLFSKLPSSR